MQREGRQKQSSAVFMRMQEFSPRRQFNIERKNSWVFIPGRPLAQRGSVKVRPCCPRVDIISSRLDSDLAQTHRSPVCLHRCSPLHLCAARRPANTLPTCSGIAHNPIIFYSVEDRKMGSHPRGSQAKRRYAQPADVRSLSRHLEPIYEPCVSVCARARVSLERHELVKGMRSLSLSATQPIGGCRAQGV